MESDTSKKRLLWEALIATASILAVTHILYAFRYVAFIQLYLGTFVAFVFLYVPVVILGWKKRPIDFLDRDLGAHFRSFLWFLVTAFLIFPPFGAASYFWMKWIFGMENFSPTAGISRSLVSYHLLMVALPEEFYFRGYLQSLFNEVWPKRGKVLGVPLGPGFWVTAVVFTIAHSVVVWEWWHFSIFFPALLFGWLREKTGSLTAPILWHAASNIFMDWFLKSFY